MILEDFETYVTLLQLMNFKEIFSTVHYEGVEISVSMPLLYCLKWANVDSFSPPQGASMKTQQRLAHHLYLRRSCSLDFSVCLRITVISISFHSENLHNLDSRFREAVFMYNCYFLSRLRHQL